MSTATLTRSDPPQSFLDEELETELAHIRDLVRLRILLAAHGATAAELDGYDGVIAGARAELAESAKHASARYATAA